MTEKSEDGIIMLLLVQKQNVKKANKQPEALQDEGFHRRGTLAFFKIGTEQGGPVDKMTLHDS